MDDQLIGKWMVWQNILGNKGSSDKYFQACCLEWVPALLVTHQYLMEDIERWMHE